MKKALEYIVTSITDYPDKVQIDEQENQNSVQFTISVASEDMGKVIGKEGKVIRAIRNVMKIPAIKANVHVSIQLAQN